MRPQAKVFVAGHGGMVGRAIVRKLEVAGFNNIVKRSHADLNLENQSKVELFFAAERPEYVFLAAAKVGGIWANSHCPADFIYSNLVIQSNIINCARKYGVKKLLFLGSSCIYPREAPQPIKEEYLLTGPLEPTNEAYAIAKIAGIKMCQAYNQQYGTDFISVMPTNLYGAHDNFDLKTSHVLPALIAKFHQAKISGEPSVSVWGSGRPRREFLHVDDLADACVFLMGDYSGSEIVNIGWGEDVSIAELALLIKNVVGFKGDIVYDSSQPDGMLRKLLDTSKLSAFGWRPRITLRDGIEATYAWYAANHADEPLAADR